MKDSPPSVNPSNQGSLTGAFEHIVNKFLQRSDHVLPAKVISYDRDLNRAQVQPLIKMVDTKGSEVDREAVAEIPVLQPGGGGYFLSFNLVSGSLGWIVACDRDISFFLKNYKNSKPNSFKISSFSNSFFIPDIMTGYSIDSEDLEGVVLQSADGTRKIAINSGTITIKAPTVIIDGDLNVTGASTVIGDIACGADITAAGTITEGVPLPP